MAKVWFFHEKRFNGVDAGIVRKYEPEDAEKWQGLGLGKTVSEEEAKEIKAQKDLKAPPQHKEIKKPGQSKGAGPLDEAAIQAELAIKLRAEIEEELRAKIEVEVRAEMEPKLRSELEEKLRPELEKKLRAELKSAEQKSEDKKGGK